MDQPQPPFEVGYVDTHINPFSGVLIDKDCCALCNAILPLPGEYPLLVVREEPDAPLYDATGGPGSTDEHGKPHIIQTGIRVLRPVCWHHAR